MKRKTQGKIECDGPEGSGLLLNKIFSQAQNVKSESKKFSHKSKMSKVGPKNFLKRPKCQKWVLKIFSKGQNVKSEV